MFAAMWFHTSRIQVLQFLFGRLKKLFIYVFLEDKIDSPQFFFLESIWYFSVYLSAIIISIMSFVLSDVILVGLLFVAAYLIKI